MDPATAPVSVYAAMAIVLALTIPVWIVARLRAGRREADGFNRTDDWAPGPDEHRKAPQLTCLTPHTRELILPHLESGETLVGFGRAFFDPARRKDWKPGSGLEKLPLLVAATSRRMLLFEVRVLNVQSTCFVPYEEIEAIEPPKPGLFGTSGRMSVRLRSGRQYRFGFLGPLLDDEGMAMEQAMAEQFRHVAAQIDSGSRSWPTRAAA
jgi:hypothetical protein